MKTFTQAMVRLGVIGTVAALGYTGYIIFEVWYWASQDQAGPADAIVVLGAAQYNGRPSPELQARLDHASELWKAHYAPTIVVTGGRIPGDEHTEAGASAAYLTKTKGVPDKDILREVDGRNTWESLEATARFLHERNIHKVLLVSDNFHDARIAAMANELDLQPLVSPTKTSPIQGFSRLGYYAREVVALGIGKFVGFSRSAGLSRSLSSG